MPKRADLFDSGYAGLRATNVRQDPHGPALQGSPFDLNQPKAALGFATR